MTRLVEDDVAKAIWANQEVWILPVEDRRNWSEMSDDAKRPYVDGAKTAIAVIARWLREPSEETTRYIGDYLCFHSTKQNDRDAQMILRALASHLEEQK